MGKRNIPDIRTFFPNTVKKFGILLRVPNFLLILGFTSHLIIRLMLHFHAITFIVRFSIGILLRMECLWIIFLLVAQKGENSFWGILVAFYAIYLAISLLPFVLLYLSLQVLSIRAKRLFSQKTLLHTAALLNTLVVFAFFGVKDAQFDSIVGMTLAFTAVSVHFAIWLTYQMRWAKNRMNELYDVGYQQVFGLSKMEEKIEEIGQGEDK